MKAVKEYFIVKGATPDELVLAVNAAIGQNKQVFGNPFVVVTSERVTYFQAMAYYSADSL